MDNGPVVCDHALNEAFPVCCKYQLWDIPWLFPADQVIRVNVEDDEFVDAGWLGRIDAASTMD